MNLNHDDMTTRQGEVLDNSDFISSSRRAVVAPWFILSGTLSAPLE
jgi:hypothetical protein